MFVTNRRRMAHRQHGHSTIINLRTAGMGTSAASKVCQGEVGECCQGGSWAEQSKDMISLVPKLQGRESYVHVLN